MTEMTYLKMKGINKARNLKSRLDKKIIMYATLIDYAIMII